MRQVGPDVQVEPIVAGCAPSPILAIHSDSWACS
jgi:hypothetical protein